MPDIISHRPIAFTERESCDPITGEHGILRREFRLVPFNSSNPLHHTISLYRRSAGQFTPTIILETRYIRRGTIEPWEVFDGYETETEALSYIDPRAIAIDCPALMWVQHDYRKSMREHAERLAQERENKSRHEEEQRLRGLSIDAWYKLYNDPRYRPLCDEWNEMTTSPGAASIKEDLQHDNEFMKLYTLAHRGAITATSKRKAMRACIDYYNFMWKHREKTT